MIQTSFPWAERRQVPDLLAGVQFPQHDSLFILSCNQPLMLEVRPNVTAMNAICESFVGPRSWASEIEMNGIGAKCLWDPEVSH